MMADHLMDLASYSASKGAIANLTRQVAVDYAPDRIHANALCPGCRCITRACPCDADRVDTQTAIFRDVTTRVTTKTALDNLHPLKGAGLPEDIARMAVVLASDDASWMTGACVPVDGGYTAQ